MCVTPCSLVDRYHHLRRNWWVKACFWIEDAGSECLRNDGIDQTTGCHITTKEATYVWRYTEALFYNHCCRGKTISIAHSECVSVALVIQHAKRMRHIILLSVACLSLPYISTLSHKQHDHRRKILNIKRVFWFYVQLCLKYFPFDE